MMFLCAEAILKCGCGLAGVLSMLSKLTPCDAKTWADASIVDVSLGVGDAVWAPAGYLTWMVATSQETSFVVQVPCLPETLTVPGAPHVKAALQKMNNEFVTSQLSTSPWTEMGPALRRWW